MGKVIINVGDFLPFSPQWVEAEKHQALVLDLAVQAKGRRQACTLQIAETASFENKLRRAAGERKAEHANRLLGLKAWRVLEIDDCFPIRSQPWQHRWL